MNLWDDSGTPIDTFASDMIYKTLTWHNGHVNVQNPKPIYNI